MCLSASRYTVFAVAILAVFVTTERPRSSTGLRRTRRGAIQSFESWVRFQVSISDGLMYVADLRIADAICLPAIGFDRLQFSLEVNFQATRGRAVGLGGLTGFLYTEAFQAGLLWPLGIAVGQTH
jgi:hypothetical protein